MKVKEFIEKFKDYPDAEIVCCGSDHSYYKANSMKDKSFI